MTLTPTPPIVPLADVALVAKLVQSVQVTTAAEAEPAAAMAAADATVRIKVVRRVMFVAPALRSCSVNAGFVPPFEIKHLRCGARTVVTRIDTWEKA